MDHPLLKFMTCGSVDDGKSTLIGHILYRAKLLFADQKRALELDSKLGAADGRLDYSLLLDGLMAEREQGITIDVAYRYFTTEKRSFIVADTPGHEEYTRNMAVGASFADAAVILVDASRGILVQTRRHLRICILMGIRTFAFALNKMDLVDYSDEVYRSVCHDIREMMQEFSGIYYTVIPVSATDGDNIVDPSDRMLWYGGKPLLAWLEEVEVVPPSEDKGFVMPVQRVCRPNAAFRGFAGEISIGTVHTGDRIHVWPSGEEACVREIFRLDREVSEASAGEPVTLTLDTEIDISRGCILTKDTRLERGTSLETQLLWMDESALIPGRNYYLKLATQNVPALISHIRYRIDVNTGKHESVDELKKNELAVCDLLTGAPLVFDRFRNKREMGCFILVDRVTNHTAACGIVRSARTGERNLTWQELDIDRKTREASLGQKAMTIWFTGLSGAGKSVIANALEIRLHTMGKHTMLLDGDNIRMGLNRDLGFSETDREENIRRIAEVSHLLNEAGIIVLTAFISPLSKDRRNAKGIIGRENFREIYLSTPLAECERRDVKGLYRKAREGVIPEFTGISSPYEAPRTADLVLDTTGKTVEECVDAILEVL